MAEQVSSALSLVPSILGPVAIGEGVLRIGEGVFRMVKEWRFWHGKIGCNNQLTIGKTIVNQSESVHLVGKVAATAVAIHKVGWDVKDRIWHSDDNKYLSWLASSDCGGLAKMSKAEEDAFRKNARNAVHWIGEKGGDPTFYQNHFERCFHIR